MAEAIVIFKSLCTRILFFSHGFWAVYLGALFFENSLVWIVALSMAALLIETIYTLWWRKGQEYKYFWPSGFFYIMTIIPVIWIFDLASLDIIKLASKDPPISFIGLGKDKVGRLIFELGLIFGIIIGRWLMPRGKLTRDQLSALLIGYVGTAADIVELKVETEIKDSGKEQITLAVLVAYTWAILQFTLMTTATIKDRGVEEQEEKAKTNRKISMNLGHYNKVSPEGKTPGLAKKDSMLSSSRYSFNSIVRDNFSTIKEMSAKEQYIDNIRRQRAQTLDTSQQKRISTVGRKFSGLDSAGTPKKTPPHKSTQSFDAEADRKQSKMRKLHGELFQILVTLLMQDGPFLVLRLVLLVEFKVITEMHMLFLAKNAIVCTLLIYRLCILTCKAEDAEEQLQKEAAASKLHNVQLAVMAGNMLRGSSRRANGRRSQTVS
ncbi:transmembrane protein 26-like [Rhopilema esculentum]|uniref:transmembrane protein 26-like n=1 Tax=Rhopilema esculentum TaxID=499914 RepID=UPI0031E0E395